MRVACFPCICLCFILLYSCGRQNGSYNSPAFTADTILVYPARHFFNWQNELSTLYDSTFADGFSVNYSLDKEQTIWINWGNALVKRSVADAYYPGWAPSEIEHEWAYFIGFRHSCGSPCWTQALFPKNQTDSIRSYEYPLLNHATKDILFYREYLNENRFVIENINSQQRITLVPDHFPEFGFFLDGLDTFYFDKDYLVLTWKTELDFSDDTPTKTKRFPLDALYPKWEHTNNYVISGIPVVPDTAEYFERTIPVTVKSKNEPFQKTRFSTYFSTYCDTVETSVLKWPGFQNVKEVIRVDLVFSTCGWQTYRHYILVEQDGKMEYLPVINYAESDNPDPWQAYVFPNEKYGQEGKILLMEFTPVYGGTEIEKARILGETAYAQ